MAKREAEPISDDAELGRDGVIPSWSEIALLLARDIEKLPPGQRNLLPDFYRAQRWLAQGKDTKPKRLMGALVKLDHFQALEEESPDLLNEIARLTRSKSEGIRGRGC